MLERAPTPRYRRSPMALLAKCTDCFSDLAEQDVLCHYCGARIIRMMEPVIALPERQIPTFATVGEEPGAPIPECPRCRVPLPGVALSDETLWRCPRCRGSWLDRSALVTLPPERWKRTPLAARPQGSAPGTPACCPRCSHWMRAAWFFQRCPTVIEECEHHGAWFDNDALATAVAWLLTQHRDSRPRLLDALADHLAIQPPSPAPAVKRERRRR
ncbi:MAG: hypothetical protein EXR72_18030 [Myxococcales bacterium]|nr:hypothetical protein [Myxococcales bacterium]